MYDKVEICTSAALVYYSKEFRDQEAIFLAEPFLILTTMISDALILLPLGAAKKFYLLRCGQQAWVRQDLWQQQTARMGG